MGYCIEINNVTKRFGEQTVLSSVSAQFETGKTYGLVGRNGSGKTVLMKCILGFIPVSEGEIRVWGKRIGKDADMPPDTGVIIEYPGFLPNYSGYANLKYLADIRKKVGRDEVMEAIMRVGLDPASRKPVGKYSMGMRQRLGLAQALMEKPKLLILDEPMNGLDNQGVGDMHELLLSLKKEGITILLASHNEKDIDLLCDHVFAMDRGKMTQMR